MPQNERRFGDGRKLLPVTIGNGQIRVADATGFHLDQHIIVARLGTFNLRQRQGLLHFLQDRGFHYFLLDERTLDCFLAGVLILRFNSGSPASESDSSATCLICSRSQRLGGSFSALSCQYIWISSCCRLFSGNGYKRLLNPVLSICA